MRYATLHNHTIYSIKDAIADVNDYVKYIHEYNISSSEHEIVALAITEHSNLFSLIPHHLACVTPMQFGNKKKTLKPIYGNEIYHYDKDTDTRKNHLVLLARNNVGITNLKKLSTLCGFNKIKTGVKEYQMCNTSDLAKYSEGLICLTACMGNKINYHLENGELGKAEEFVLYLKKIYKENLYLEIQPHDGDQRLLNDFLRKMSETYNIEMVITSDSHYTTKEDREYHDIMKEIDAISRKLEDINGLKFKTDNHMWLPEELIQWCNDNGFSTKIITNTAKIADMCTADITPKDSKGLMPEFPCPKGYTPDSYLTKLVNNGLRERFITNKSLNDLLPYVKRMNYELNIITQLGFSSYFLILWDWFKWCKGEGIILGPGRGSAAGSLLCYLLDITKIDPVKNNLIFERFLNLQRAEVPDKIIC